MPLQLTDSQQVTYTIAPKDKKGQPAPVSDPTWSSSNEAVATVEPAADGLSAVVKAGIPGDATISVSADADLGSGVTTVGGSADITVVSGAAISVDLEAGTPSEQ